VADLAAGAERTLFEAAAAEVEEETERRAPTIGVSRIPRRPPIVDGDRRRTFVL